MEKNMDKKAYYINRVSVAVLLLLFNLTIPNNLDLSILYISNYKISFTFGSVFLMLATFFRVTIWGRLREGAESYAKALASDILR